MLDFLKKLFLSKKTTTKSYSKFEDYFGNFRLTYPSNWKFDDRIAVMDGMYTISFESKNKEKFIISLETILPQNLNFEEYAKEKLTGPSSGVHATIIKTNFQQFPAYEIEYSISSGPIIFCRSFIFCTVNRIFFISISAPKKTWHFSEPVFTHILNSLEVVRKK